MLHVFFLSYVFIPVWHSSAQTIYGSWFLEKKRERKPISKLSCPPGRPPLEVGKNIHSYFSVLLPRCYPKTGLYRVPGVGNLQEEYARAKDPLIKIL